MPIECLAVMEGRDDRDQGLQLSRNRRQPEVRMNDVGLELPYFRFECSHGSHKTSGTCIFCTHHFPAHLSPFLIPLEFDGFKSLRAPTREPYIYKKKLQFLRTTTLPFHTLPITCDVSQIASSCSWTTSSYAPAH